MIFKAELTMDEVKELIADHINQNSEMNIRVEDISYRESTASVEPVFKVEKNIG